jgi:hypothetical protein
MIPKVAKLSHKVCEQTNIRSKIALQSEVILLALRA